jgi:hypothetical protein
MKYKKFLFSGLIAICTIVFSANTFAEMSDSVSQWGITWTFDQQYECGQFVNGDWWVIGPVDIIGITPESKEVSSVIKNGSMINPMPGKQGFDNTIKAWDVNTNVALGVSETSPLQVEPGSSLVSSISKDGENNRPQLKTAAVLTVLASEPPQGSFRPAYCGTDKDIKFDTSQLDYSLLKQFEPVSSTPSFNAVERHFERPWIDLLTQETGRFIHPSENMPDYGRNMSSQIGVGALMLNIDSTNEKKSTLLIRMVQLGIDFHALAMNGRQWFNNGGHASGRKFPILFAGFMLGDSAMKAISEKSGDYLYSGDHGAGNPPDDYQHFGEDDQTFYVKESDVYVFPYVLNHTHTAYTNHGSVIVYNDSAVVKGVNTSWTHDKVFGEGKAYLALYKGDTVGYSKQSIEGVGGYKFKITAIDEGSQTLTLDEPYDGFSGEYNEYVISERPWFGHGFYGKSNDYTEYTTDDLGLPEWGIKHSTLPSGDGKEWNTAYRQNPTGGAWPGWVLAVHFMKLKEEWNHDALFDYQDRFMDKQLELYGANDYRRSWSNFAADMWDEYRDEVYDTSISVSPASLSLGIGETDTLVETLLPEYLTDEQVSWFTSDENIATVDDNGVVTAIAEGNCIISVTALNIGDTAECDVSVITISVTGVTVSPPTLNLNTGQTADLTKSISPSNASNKLITWATTDPFVATVNSNGKVTAVAEGNCGIIVETDDGGFTDTCTVTVSTEESVNDAKEEKNMISIYPNPLDENDLIIELGTVNKAEVVILDITGRKIYNKTVCNTRLMVDNEMFKAGTYIVKVFTEGQVITDKIIVK